MILVEKPKLKFLLAGRQISVDVSREYRKGRIYAAGASHKRSACRVLVLNASQTGDAEWTLTIRHWTQERAVYLAADPGAMRSDYTTDSTRAARGVDGAPIEAVADDGWLSKVAKLASDRDDVLRREMAHRARVENRGKIRPIAGLS